MTITAKTRIGGVVGNPVRHSLSPQIHNAWIAAAGIDAVYLAFEPAKDRFRAFVEGLRGGVVLGLNVTIPFKEEALASADTASAAARQAGASNLLLLRPDGSIEADNTDGVGLIGALERCGDIAGDAVVIGAGGAARGAVMALLERGVSRVRLINRTLERAQAIAVLDGRIEALPMARAADALEGAHILVNATSLGMEDQPPLELKLDALPADALVLDMVYRPLATALLAAAKARGNPVANGLDMLIAQAAPSYLRIFGQTEVPAVDVRPLLATTP